MQNTQTIKPKLNYMKTVLITASISLLLFSCSPADSPYKKTLENHFERNSKVIPEIVELRTDSIINMADYNEYWMERIESLKQDLTNDYRKSFKDDSTNWARRMQKNKAANAGNKDYYNANMFKESMDGWKMKLDSAEQGLYNYPVIDIFTALSEEKKTILVQVNAKLKLAENGATLNQNFVIEQMENDTAVYILDEPIFKFVSKSGLRR